MVRPSVGRFWTVVERELPREPLSEINRDRVYWYGGMDFLGHFWDLFGVRRIEILVKVHPGIETSYLQNSSRSRKELSQACYEIVVSRG